VPPSRRRPPPSTGQVPPVRRPRVAGLRNRQAARENEPERDSVSGRPDVEDTSAATEPAAEPDAREGVIGADADDFDEYDEDQVSGDDGAPTEDDDRADLDAVDHRDEAEEPAEPAARPRPSRRPEGKRRAAGITRPANLREAEAETRTSRVRRVDNPRARGANRLSVAIVLAVVAVLLAGLAIWFRGESSDLESGDANSALTDSAATSEAVGQLKSAIETTFSYNYTDLESTQKAVDETLTGKARCEYDQLFGQVKKLAPKQKIVMVTAVREIALVRLDGDRAEALVFIDQSSTRVDVNNSVAGEAQFAVLGHREGGKWKITEFNMFDQPLVNGQPAPKC
jgi:Mce-associated membrane protein